MKYFNSKKGEDKFKSVSKELKNPPNTSKMIIRDSDF